MRAGSPARAALVAAAPPAVAATAARAAPSCAPRRRSTESEASPVRRWATKCSYVSYLSSVPPRDKRPGGKTNRQHHRNQHEGCAPSLGFPIVIRRFRVLEDDQRQRCHRLAKRLERRQFLQA